ncbi:hypothetical protein KP509_37G032900 [Ceratopteris richardii]|nr:hypothetical protein KP509_37G032900 [Ceratopteris richardii]
MMKEFHKCFGDDIYSNGFIETNTFKRDFGSTIEKKMQEYLDQKAKTVVKISSVKDKSQQPKIFPVDNVERVQITSQTNGESEILSFQIVENNDDSNKVDKDRTLSFEIRTFDIQSKRLKRKIWIHNVKVRIVAILICITIIFSIWLMICKGIHC